MKASKVYLRAAESVAEHWETYSCIAIHHAGGFTGGGFSADAMRYSEAFGSDCEGLQYYFECENDDESPRALRVLALLLMSEIARSEE